jgi:signal peptidase I
MMITPLPRRSLLVSTALLALALAANAQAGNMTYDAAVSDALSVVAHRPELSVMRIAGQSMLPFFGDDAVVVVKKIDAARLRAGMIAVYVNRFGEKIAHRVIAPVDGGWQVKGYNNDAADSTVVNGSNLLGVVYATFYSAGRAPVTIAAANLPAIETVYAAPAK